MELEIKVIPYSKMRYPSAGDWIFKDGKLKEIIVADLDNENYNFLVAVHELIEAYLCQKKGITEEEVNKFDMDYEESRESGYAPCECEIQEEPGFDKHAPYRNEHEFAAKIEKLIAKKLGVNWGKYDKAVMSLGE